MEKLNIAELLKGCPKGMELDCAIYENVELDYIEQNSESTYPIHCLMKTNGGYNVLMFTRYGCNDMHPNAKCVIYPKGKTTWEGFQRPFKDGDIVAFDNPHRDNLQVFIFKNKKENNILSSCYLMLDDDELDLEEGMYYVTRFATEEEKEKLFKAIKDNDYCWNAETKTLEKLPKFKVGDQIVKRNSISNSWIVASVSSEYYGLKLPNGSEDIGVLPISEQDNWKLVPNKFNINTLKPFESRVLVRNVGCWEPAFWGYYSKEYAHPFVVDGGNTFAQCIPYEENKHLLGTTNDCDEYFKTWE